MPTENHILLVDDDPGILKVVGVALEQEGYTVTQARRVTEARELLRAQGYHLVLSDMRLPDGDGLEVLETAKENQPGVPVLLMTGFGTVDGAVEAMRRGALDYLEKPINLEHLRFGIRRALRRAVLDNAYDYLRHEQPYIYRFEHIVAQSPAMQGVLEQVRKVAGAEVTVLMTGETGTGKSLICGAIHANSPRAENPLVTVNCAALTETLLESELFGHEKGAFTGAHKSRVGRIQQAHGGTLFLDEVGDMSAATQAKILRAIEDKVVSPVGGSRSVKVDVRIVCATNVDLKAAVAQGRFREDLYYRLSVAPIHIPPLRERPEDILPLAERFLFNLCRDAKRPPKEFSAEARQLLGRYAWPGNIRELRNTVERAVLFAGNGRIHPGDLGCLGAEPPQPAPCQPQTLDLSELERWAILTALEQNDWVQSRAAEVLGITPRGLVYKINKLAISHPELDARRRSRH